MDNITHSLAGALIANAVLHLRAHEARQTPSTGTDGLATVAVTTGVIGANLPDADVPWNALMEAMGRYDAISSLLHHRGITHSLLAALAWITMLWGAAAWLHARSVSRSGRGTVSAAHRMTLLLVATIAVVSHVTLDFTNDYGVHPLSPFVNRWFYGDTSFIIEPWLWVLGASALLRTTRSRIARAGLGIVIVLAVVLSWLAPQVSAVPAALVTIGAVGATLFAWRTSPARATAFGITAWLMVSG
ncbi:MAG TPA: metal-dependent hydrolase, partial [Gemmatimonadaceae bacterium]|nr:metal-dependent hydrolase [Gemmatimonadaceae bacterium]